MNPAKYFTPKYWARKFFGIRPRAGQAGPQPTDHHFEIVPPEERGLSVARDGRVEAVLPESRAIAILRLFRFRDVAPEERGVHVNAESRGVQA